MTCVVWLQVINQFDKEFQEQSDDIIFLTILAANFLDIKNLLELMCKKVADEIKKCKTPDDIRDRCNAVSTLHTARSFALQPAFRSLRSALVLWLRMKPGSEMAGQSALSGWVCKPTELQHFS